MSKQGKWLILLILGFAPLNSVWADSIASKQTIVDSLRKEAREKQIQYDRQHSKAVCNTRIFVTQPKTVSFYAGKVKESNYIGITSVGQWLVDNHTCVLNKPLIAVTWDVKGKPQYYFSSIGRKQKLFNNQNNTITVQFPRDFAKAPVHGSAVICKVHFHNASPHRAELYIGQKNAAYKIGALLPWQKQVQNIPCFYNQRLMARLLVRKGNQLEARYFKTFGSYTNINHIPTVVFPSQFKEEQPLIVPLTQELLALFLL